MACFQETKVEEMALDCIISTLGSAYEDNFVALPVEGIRGGIVIAVNSSSLKLANPF
jgi:hypothetical protein